MAETLEQMADADLIAAVRQGDVEAFGALYERHLSSAKRAAAYLARTRAEREDLVAEAFTRVLRMLREGRGPDEEFRPYLLVTLRNAAINSATRGVPVSLYADIPDAYMSEDYVDPVIDRWNAGTAASAFASLPERWRMVLWHTEVEKESPAVVAKLLGMRPNSVAALAYRAREGLRQAYLRMHVPEPPRPECEPMVRKLAGYVRQNIPLPLSRKISRHLAGCADCRTRAEVLTRINSEIAGLLGPVVLGAPLAAAYLQPPATAVTAALAVGATDTGLLSGLLAAKTVALKAGAAVVVAATAMTSTAGAPVVAAPEPESVLITDADTEGERDGTFVVPGPSPEPEPSSDRPVQRQESPEAIPEVSAPPSTSTPIGNTSTTIMPTNSNQPTTEAETLSDAKKAAKEEKKKAKKAAKDEAKKKKKEEKAKKPK